ncbi:MAG: segregation/condensation protein A [Lachnospiraceae bacterium]|nr:segregation/condensation protein A [Lachnospiraceae bacterium]
MELELKLEAFEGPLDLLLHLIEKNKVDIYDIPVALITKQYMDYLEAMERADMEIMSEFIVMASTLLNIKSKMLLPKEVNEEGEEIDPREELVRQLLEYKIYRYMSYELKDMRTDALKSMFRDVPLPGNIAQATPEIDYSKIIGDNTLNTLKDALQELLKRQEDKIDPVRSKFGRIEKEEVSIENKMDYIRNFSSFRKKFTFKELMSGFNTKVELVVTFLCMLEFIKTGEFVVHQSSDGEIDIVVKEAA